MADNYKDLIQPSLIWPAMKFMFFGDAVAGAHVVTGIKTRDKLIAVVAARLALTEGTPNTIAFDQFADLTSEFTISADDEIDNTGGTTLADKLALAIWLQVPEELG